MTTVVAVFENLIAFTMSEFKIKRTYASVIVGIVVFMLALTTALGFCIYILGKVRGRFMCFKFNLGCLVTVKKIKGVE